MTARSSKLRSGWYAAGILFILLALAVLPDLLQKRRFLYTASEVQPTESAVFPLDKTFPTIKASGAGPNVKLSELAAQHPGGLLVNFWATWCAPCIEELPSLEHLNRQLEAKKDPNLPRLITISVDEHVAEVLALQKTLPFQPSFWILHDPDAVFAESMGTSRFPETYWIGSDGKVRYKWLGPQDWVSDAVLRRLASPEPVLK